MKAFIIACIAIVVIAVGAAILLDRYQKPVESVFASPTSVRI